MLNDLEAHDASTGLTAEDVFKPLSLSDTIEEVRRLKRWVQLGTYGLILVFVPLYAFLFQTATVHVFVNLLIGLVMPTAIIEVAFERVLKLRITAETALRDSEQQVRSVLHSALDAVVRMDEDGLITDWNPQAEAIFGWPHADAMGQDVWDTIIPLEQRATHREGLTRYLETGDDSYLNRRVEIMALHRDGHQFPAEFAISSARGTGSTIFSAFVRDITERQNAERALRDKSTHDALTGVLNHGAIVDKLNEVSSDDDEDHHSIAMVDVDGLKATNDTYGHQVGDELLRAVAAGLNTDGAVVGRYGGDEFVVLLRGADRDAAEKYRDEVLEAFSRATVDGPGEDSRIPIFVSIGLASYPDEADTIGGWLGLADNAMYAARKEKSESPMASGEERTFGKERAARLVAEIVPLLTRSGTREDKLNLVAQLLSVSAGYDGVNFEVSGDEAEPPEWQSAHVRAPKDIVDAWMREQSRSENHPLGKILEETRRPVFMDDVSTDERLTKKERELLTNIGFKSALVVPMIWQDRMVGMLSVGSKTDTGFHTWDAQFLTAVASQVTAIVFMTTLVEELQAATDSVREAHSETVMMLASVAEANDNTTGRHLQRVRALTESLALELEYSADEAAKMGLAAVLHDIGKIQVPNSILTSSSSLSDQEWDVMRRHTTWGAEFLRGHEGFDLAEIVAHSHHERWDGDGYPAGLKGDEISEAAAITCVADTFDAITNDRPYRAGRTQQEAVQEILSCSGTQFSPRVTAALERLYDKRALPLSPEAENQAAA